MSNFDPAKMKIKKKNQAKMRMQQNHQIKKKTNNSHLLFLIFV